MNKESNQQIRTAISSLDFQSAVSAIGVEGDAVTNVDGIGALAILACRSDIESVMNGDISAELSDKIDDCWRRRLIMPGIYRIHGQGIELVCPKCDSGEDPQEALDYWNDLNKIYEGHDPDGDFAHLEDWEDLNDLARKFTRWTIDNGIDDGVTVDDGEDAEKARNAFNPGAYAIYYNDGWSDVALQLNCSKPANVPAFLTK